MSAEYDQYYVTWQTEDVYGDTINESTVVWARNEADAIKQVKIGCYGNPDHVEAELITYPLTDPEPRK